MSTPHVQMVIFKYHFIVKGTRDPCRNMTDPKSMAGNICKSPFVMLETTNY